MLSESADHVGPMDSGQVYVAESDDRVARKFEGLLGPFANRLSSSIHANSLELDALSEATRQMGRGTASRFAAT
jgi:hypothetical protein